MGGNSSFNVWQVLAGLAFFMIGMGYLEQATKKLAGRSFKLFLKKQATHTLRAIGGATIVTGILQSSSIVNLMVLAFASTGIINMQHALALMLGSNLGTTLSTWIIATIGFKVNISAYAMPLLSIAGISRAFFKKELQAYAWLTLLLGIGFLFFGLGIMQAGMFEFVKAFDLGQLKGFHPLVFLVAGLVITSLIQSSSATVAIVLAALDVHALNLTGAMAIVLGAEIGTTVKLLLASIDGAAIKKKVAFGNSIMNTIVVSMMFLLLGWIRIFITDVLEVANPLIAISFFQTFINMASVIIFLPILKPFGSVLDRLFKNNSNYVQYINKVPATDADISLEALRKEVIYFNECVILFCADALGLKLENLKFPNQQEGYLSRGLMGKYEYIKHLHGGIYEYYIKLQKGDMMDDTVKLLNRLMSSARNAMYAGKSIKDALPDIDQLKNSANEVKYRFYVLSQQAIAVKCDVLADVIRKDEPFLEDIITIYQSVQIGYTSSLNGLYQRELAGKLNETEISTLINYNREVFSALKSLVLAIKDCVLEEKEAAYFDELPGFIK